MKVLIVRNTEAITNASIRRVADALLSDGHEPVILSRNRNCGSEDSGYLLKKINVNGVLVENYELQLSGKTEKGMKNLTTLLDYVKNINVWMKENIDKFDAIHAFDLDSGMVCKKISKKYKKKMVYHIADFYVDSRMKIPSVLKNIIRYKEYSIINYAENTIICTEERREQIKGSNPVKLTVVHNSPSIDDDVMAKIKKHLSESMKKYSDTVFTKENPLRLCYIGVLSKRRFIDKILEAVSEFENIQLDIAGGGDLEQLCRDYSSKYDNIVFYGKIDYDKTFDLYLECDLMFAIYNPAINNHKYSAANKIYEAMLMKKPIIVCRDTSMDKIVEKNNIGFVIDYSVEELSSLLESIVKNPSVIDEKVADMDGVYDMYSWSEMKKRLVDIYREIGKGTTV